MSEPHGGPTAILTAADTGGKPSPSKMADWLIWVRDRVIGQAQGGTGATSFGAATVTSTGGSTAQTLADKLGEHLSYGDRGAPTEAGNGTTENAAALAAAVTAAAGETLFIPAGTYKVTLTSANQIGVAANTRIVGAGPGRTILNVTTALSYARLFSQTGANVTFENMTIHLTAPSAGQLVGFYLNGDRFTARNCEITGNTAATGGAAVQETFVAQAGPNDADDATFENLRISGHSYCLQRANSTTSTMLRPTFRSITAINMWRSAIDMNAPEGTVADMTIDGCVFSAAPGYATGGLANCSFIAIARVRNLTITNNRFDGSDPDACPRVGIHIEDSAGEIVIDGNVGRFDFSTGALENRAAVEVLNSTVSGDAVPVPTNIVIGDNVFRQFGTPKQGFGVWVVDDATPSDGFEVVIGHTICVGFEDGFSLDSATGRVLKLAGTIASNCTTGYRFTRAAAVVDGASHYLCDTPFEFGAGASAYGSTHVVATVAATGSDQAGAALVRASRTHVTDADGTKGVRLPNAVPGLEVWVTNAANAVLKVYPDTDDLFRGLAANAPIDVAANGGALFVCTSGAVWGRVS